VTVPGCAADLFEYLACADAAIVQGGLSTTMELVATRRPFIYFPLRRHWEQQHFVTHRLDYYRAGLRMDYTTTTADDLATTMRAALGGSRHPAGLPEGAARGCGPRRRAHRHTAGWPVTGTHHRGGHRRPVRPAKRGTGREKEQQ